MTKELRYIGKHDAVFVRLGSANVLVSNDGTVKVTKEQADSLLEQPGNWVEAVEKAGKPANRRVK
jgi:hypothetical protein